MDLSSSVRSNVSNFNSPAHEDKIEEEEDPNAGIELLECNDNLNDTSVMEGDVTIEVKDNSFWGRTKRFFHFLLETLEYKDPATYGWRIKFRRIFLTVGTLAFTFQTIKTAITTQNFSSKEEIQNILDYLGTNLTWPDSGSALDDVFQLYNSMERTQSYLMMMATFLFWIGLILDFSSHYATAKTHLL